MCFVDPRTPLLPEAKQRATTAVEGPQNRLAKLAKLQKNLPIPPNSKSHIFAAKAHRKQNLTTNFVEKLPLCV